MTPLTPSAYRANRRALLGPAPMADVLRDRVETTGSCTRDDLRAA